MNNTYYSAFTVAKNYCDANNLAISNYGLIDSSPNYIYMFVETNSKNISNIVCLKNSATQFLIWAYGNDYTEISRTSYNYADVNTPNLQNN